MPVACRCAFYYQVGKQVISLMPNRCWMRLTFQFCAVFPVSAADGCWPTRAMTSTPYAARYRMQSVIPLRRMKRKPWPGLPRLFDRPKYRQRNIIECMFGWLKEHRRIMTRFDKLAKSYAAMVSLACAMRCLRYYFSCRA
ncbi:hypothetical protein D3C85_749870 [compost metagenome]